MKILIDLQSAQSGSRFGGIGRYSMDLLRAMLENHQEHDFHILLNALLVEGIEEINAALYGLIPRENIHFFNVPGPVCRAGRDNRFRSKVANLIRDAYIAKINPDVLHVTSLIEGYMDEVVVGVTHVFYKGPVFVTLYDLIPLVEKDKYLADPHVREYYFDMVGELKKSSHLLSISEYSKVEAVSELGYPAEKVTNISSAISSFFKTDLSELDFSQIMKKYGIAKRFLLYTASFDQRKNQLGLIEAFSRLSNEERNGLQLVIVGNGWSSIYEELNRKAVSFGLEPNEVVFTGKVTDDELLALYRSCSAFVFPSFREGFGLPILEAMTCGAPVLASNTTCIPEVVGMPDAMFDPSSPEDICRKISRLLKDDLFRASLIRNGEERIKLFSWKKSAQVAVDAFEKYGQSISTVGTYDVSVESLIHEAVALRRVDDSVSETDFLQLTSALYKLENTDLAGRAKEVISDAKVALVSTWNTKCGIADYTKMLTSAFDLTYAVFAPKVGKDDLVSDDERFVHRCWQVNSTDLSDLGYSISQSRAKVVVVQFNYGFFDFSAFEQLLRFLRSNGCVVYVCMHSTKDPFELKGYRELKMLSRILTDVHSVLVHSPSDIKRLQAVGVFNCEVISHGLPVLKDVNKIETSESQSNGIYNVATFGYFLPNKGLLQVVKALSLLRARGLDVRLLMLNAEYNDPASRSEIEIVRQEVSRLDLQAYVDLRTEYLPAEQCQELLSQVDVVVFPYQSTGESSSAAVRNGLLSLRPVLVTPLDIFDDVSEVVFKMSGFDPDSLASGIENMLKKLEGKDEDLGAKLAFNEQWVRDNSFHAVSKRFCESLKNSTCIDA